MIRSFIFDYDCSQSGICKTNELMQNLESNLGVKLQNQDQDGFIEILHEPNFHIIKIDFQKITAPKAETIRPIVFGSLAEVTAVPQEKQSWFDKIKGIFRL